MIILKFPNNGILSLAAALGFSSCANRPVVVTSSQVGAHVSGTSTTAPNKSTFGYARSEWVHLPKGVSHGGIVGSLDTEFRNFSGAAITETLITGDAASAIMSDNTPPQPLVAQDGISSPMDLISIPQKKIQGLPNSKVISTNTRANLGIEAGGSDGAGPSFNFGFRRAVAAIFAPPKETKKDGVVTDVLPSTYADISIHAGGINGNTIQAKAIPGARRIDDGAIGSRTVQRIATGRAAALLANQPETKSFIRKQIRGDKEAEVE